MGAACHRGPDGAHLHCPRESWISRCETRACFFDEVEIRLSRIFSTDLCVTMDHSSSVLCQQEAANWHKRSRTATQFHTFLLLQVIMARSCGTCTAHLKARRSSAVLRQWDSIRKTAIITSTTERSTYRSSVDTRLRIYSNTYFHHTSCL